MEVAERRTLPDDYQKWKNPQLLSNSKPCKNNTKAILNSNKQHKITRIVKCDLVKNRQNEDSYSHSVGRPSKSQRDTTSSPVIRSIYE